MAVQRSPTFWPIMTCRSWRPLIALGFFVMLLSPLWGLRGLERRQPLLKERERRPKGGECEGFPDLQGITFVLKTGATEAFDKVPLHLLTSLQCVDDYLLFSDLEQQIGRHKLYDVLDRVDQSVKESHSEFKLYEAQVACPVSQKDCTGDMPGAWELDKFKFLNMVNRTWELRPNRRWYVFAEADTYVVWRNMAHYLRSVVRPDDFPYFGSVAMFEGYPFAHGGSGYVVSGAALRRMVEGDADLAGRWDGRTEGECCGDVMFAKAAGEVGVVVKQALPLFNGEKPYTLPYGPEQWCEPILTMHHLNAEEVSAVWQFEKGRARGADFLQIKDLYHAFFAPKLVPYRTDWDNLSEDTCYISPDEGAQQSADEKARRRQKTESEKNAVERQAHRSPAACAKVCESEGLDIDDAEFGKAETQTGRERLLRWAYEEKVKREPEFGRDRRCFQWRFRGGVCCTSKNFRLGAPRREVGGEGWTSGWFVRGIENWVGLNEECPVRWIMPG